MAKKKSKTKPKSTAPRVTVDTSKKTGFFSKIGGFFKKALPTALSFIPGVGGIASKVAESALSKNDPEWWRKVRGFDLATNQPLGILNYKVSMGDGSSDISVNSARFAIAEFYSSVSLSAASSTIISPTDDMINTYLLPAVREVDNAIALQSVSDYKTAFSAQCTLYAAWQNLKKLEWLASKAPVNMPNLFAGAFPILAPTGQATLQSLIRMIEERLHAAVRIPHTMCEYLAWRYGRIYRSNHSAKAGMIMYNVLPLTATTTEWTSYVTSLLTVLSASGVAQAATDIFNAYRDHDLAVHVEADSQYQYDAKEFCLRTNLDVSAVTSGRIDALSDVVIMDSNLDNAETYMASTVSTVCKYPDETTASVLFPVTSAIAYIYAAASSAPAGTSAISGSWRSCGLSPVFISHQSTTVVSITDAVMAALLACKSLDLYNMDQFYGLGPSGAYIDMTSISIDTALVPNETISTEQKLAFANLTFRSVKSKVDHYGEKRQLAQDLAHVVEDVTDAQSVTVK